MIVVVYSLPRSGSSEFCRQIQKRLHEDLLDQHTINVGEFLVPFSHDFYCTGGGNYLIDYKKDPDKILNFIDEDLSIDTALANLEVMNKNRIKYFSYKRLLETTIVSKRFKSEEELIYYVNYRMAKRVEFLGKLSDAGVNIIIKQFGPLIDQFNLDHSTILYYRKNLEENIFSMLYKRVCIDKDVSSLMNGKDQSAMETMIKNRDSSVHNMSGTEIHEPQRIEILQDEFTEILSRTAETLIEKFIGYYSTLDFNPENIVAYEDFFNGKEYNLNLGKVKIADFKLTNPKEHKMIYSSSNPKDYITTYNIEEVYQHILFWLDYNDHNFGQKLGLCVTDNSVVYPWNR